MLFILTFDSNFVGLPMKNYLSLTFCLLLALSLVATACGDDDTSENNQTSTHNTESHNTDPNNTEPNNSEPNNTEPNNAEPNNIEPNNTEPNNSEPNNTEPSGAQFCRSECEEASDCGPQSGWVCVDNLCMYEDAPEEVCTGDAECVAVFSGWMEACTGDQQCADTQACIDHDGEGFCAFEEGEFVDCDQMNMELVTKDRFGDIGQADVCGQPTANCHPEDQYCQLGCQANADCDWAGVDTCVDGVCRCGSDAACEGLDGADTCYDGVCGCSSDETCQGTEFDVCT